jgi:hypothetical protein
VTGTTTPKRLRLRLIGGTWDGFFSSLAEIKTLLDENSAVSVDVKSERDGWVSIPLTDYVKTWLSGGLYNNGFAISGETDGETYSFASIVGEESDAPGLPYIAVSGEVGDRALIYGKYGDASMSMPEGMDDNCMSYALRDTTAILADDLGLDKNEMVRIYTEAAAGKGVDALADYTAKFVTDYVEAHKDGLQISRFRRLDNYDSETDPQTEYRIALRVGVNLIDNIVDFSNNQAFDYHFWAQLNDGRWVQKFPSGSSMIIPCTGPGIPPGKYPWDSGYERTAKSADYYTSKTICFAVTKDTDEFTHHRGE